LSARDQFQRGWAPRVDRCRVRARVAPTLTLATLLIFCLVMPPSADAVSATWAGASPGRTKSSASWSQGANWQGDLAPSATEALEALVFPHLSGCAGTLPGYACYLSFNDLGEMSTDRVELDDSDPYLIAGESVAIGSGGLAAAPGTALPSEEGGDTIEALIRLDASQTWRIEGQKAAGLANTGMILAGPLFGPGSALTLQLSEGPLFFLAEDFAELGPVTIEGEDKEVIAKNGLVSLLDARLNASDGEPVTVSNVFFAGSGAVGPLTTNDATVDVGAPEEDLEVASARLEDGTSVEFNVTAVGTSAPSDYTQLISHGSVELNGAKIDVVLHPEGEGATCPTLTPGETLTLLSTTGTLSGTFSNAPEEGDEITIRDAAACATKLLQTIAISYHEKGARQTVTGTVEPLTKSREEGAAKRRKQEEELRKKKEEEEAAARKKKEEDAAGPGGAPAEPTGSRTYTMPGAIEPLPVNKQIEEEFWAKMHQSSEQEPSTPAPAKCRVPKLTGDTLMIARLALHRAHCGLGRVSRPKRAVHEQLVVVGQGKKPGTVRNAGFVVDVRLGRRAKHHSRS